MGDTITEAPESRAAELATNPDLLSLDEANARLGQLMPSADSTDAIRRYQNGLTDYIERRDSPDNAFFREVDHLRTRIDELSNPRVLAPHLGDSALRLF